MAGYESREGLEKVVVRMLELMRADEKVAEASKGVDFAVGFAITDLDATFLFNFKGGQLTGETGEDIRPAQIKLSMDSDTFNAVFTGELDPVGAAMWGRIAVSGDIGLAMSLLGVVDDLRRIYTTAKEEAGIA
ncbi:MAG: SCP2 sterol-binding domain-containing protein [Bacillota bacterium]